MEIINFKDTKELKDAVKIAAVKEGHANTSKFLSHIVRENTAVQKELKKTKKKVV